MKYSQDFARKIFEHVAEGKSVAAICRAYKLSRTAIWFWCRDSLADFNNGVEDSKFKVRGVNPNNEDEIFWFHSLVNDIGRKLAQLNLDLDAVASLEPKPVRTGEGQIIYETDDLIAADALAMDDIDWELTYGNRKRTDIYKRDENGALIPVTEVKAPATWRTHVYRSKVPGFNPAQGVEVSKTVTHVAPPKKERPQTGLTLDLEARYAALMSQVQKNRPALPPPPVSDDPLKNALAQRAALRPETRELREIKPGKADSDRDAENVGPGRIPIGGVKMR